MNRTRRSKVGLVVVSLAVGAALTGCSSDAAMEEPAAQPAKETPTKEAPTEKAEPALDCEKVGPKMMQFIADLAQDGTGMKPVKAAAYRSPDFEKVYLIAMEFSATGIDNQVGVWGGNALEPGGGILLSVDGTAQQFTDYVHADDTNTGLRNGDPGVEKARECLAQLP